MKTQSQFKSITRPLTLALATLLFGAAPSGAEMSAEEIMKESHLKQYYAAQSGRANVEMTIMNKNSSLSARIWKTAAISASSFTSKPPETCVA